jgi:hypothetical protein
MASERDLAQPWAMLHDLTSELPGIHEPRALDPLSERREEIAPATAVVDAPTSRPLEPQGRRRLAFRVSVRTAHGYLVDAPGGRIGHVAEVRVAPYEFWPEALLVTVHDGRQLLIPVSAVARAYPREQTLVLREAPPGIDLIPYRARSWYERTGIWRLVEALGFAGGVGGYVATFALLALGAAVAAAPILAMLGAIGAVASGAAWHAGRRTWLGAAGLGSAWLPLSAGVILSLVSLFG